MICAPKATPFPEIQPQIDDAEQRSGQELLKNEDISSLSFYTGIKDNFNNMIRSLNYIVLVLIISAGMLAFVVLYNLTNVNISERLREIATLKVLGFYNKEVNTYVYKENVILTLIGALVGLGLGKILHLTSWSSSSWTTSCSAVSFCRRAMGYPSSSR